MDNIKTKKDIFKAYDVRGIYPEELNEETIRRIGRAYAELRKKETGKDDVVFVVGRDMRLSSPELTKKIIDGIVEQGVSVIDIGVVSTPTFYYGVSMLEADGGMMVSASHNPKEYNGVKIVRDKALPVGFDNGISEIYDLTNQNDFKNVDKKGSVKKNDEILKKQIDYAFNFVDTENIKKLKIVVDPANSMGAPYLESMFKRLPMELIKMNFELDGSFPAHEADPFKEENIADLKNRVIKEGADLGVATDGDGDRVFFVDNKGELIDPSIIRGLLAKIVLKEKPDSTICYDIRPGRITRDMIKENGGKPCVTRVGHSLIKEKAIKVGANFSGESSGHFFFKTEFGFFETPVIVILNIIKYICEEDKSVFEIIKPLKKYYHSGEINSEVKDKEGKMKELAEKYKDAKNISWLDGVTIEYDDYWFNVRPSNTESLLRLNLEAMSKEIMEDKRDEVLEIIRS